MAVALEAVAAGDLAPDPAHGQVHLRAPPRSVVCRLAEDRDIVAGLAVVEFPMAWPRMNSTDRKNVPEDPQQGS